MLSLPKNTDRVKKLLDVIDRSIPPHRALWELREYFSALKSIRYDDMSLLLYVVYRTNADEIKLIRI